MKRRGRGYAAVNYPTGMNLGGDPSQALIHATTTGSFVITLSSVDLGQGLKTVVAQCAAETLGLPLEMILVLVDGEIGPTPLDTQLLDWLGMHALPHAVVATKHDKVKASRREKRKRELAARCGLAPSDVVWTSAAKGVGIDRLRGLVRMWLGLD